MTLSCSGSIGAALHYKGVKAQIIKVINPGGNVWNNEVNSLISVVRPNNPSNYLTWEWEEDLWWRKWLIKISYQSGNSSTCGQTFIWETSTTQPDNNVELIARDDLWYGFYIPPEHPRYTSGDPNGYWVSANRLLKVAQCSSSSTSPLALNAAIDSVEPYPGENTLWHLNFYENGEKITSLALMGQMENPPTEAIFDLWNKTYAPISISFEKQINTEALELLPVPNSDESWQLWRVQIDENQDPISKEVIYQFQGIEPELFCLDDNECPPNTCKVDCGGHYCCYNSGGYSVHSFIKP